MSTAECVSLLIFRRVCVPVDLLLIFPSDAITRYSLTTIFDTSFCVIGTITMLIGNAISMDVPQTLGHCVITSMKDASSIDSMARDITPDIDSDMRKENV